MKQTEIAAMISDDQEDEQQQQMDHQLATDDNSQSLFVVANQQNASPLTLAKYQSTGGLMQPPSQLQYLPYPSLHHQASMQSPTPSSPLQPHQSSKMNTNAAPF